MNQNVRSAETKRLARKLDDIGRRCTRLPLRDERSADEILRYDEHGLPHQAGEPLPGKGEAISRTDVALAREA